VEVHRDSPRQPSRTLDVSLVIPVCNGADFIGDSVTRARDFLAQRCPSFEIVVVNDGSSDDTAAKVQPVTDDRVRLITLPTNAGKFAAVAAGMAAANGRCRVFTDADLPYDLEAIPFIVDLVTNDGFHIVAGDRTLPESCSLTQTDVARQLSSRVFSFFARMLVTGGLFDSQCGLKGFRSDVAEALFPLLTHTGFSGDVELLYIALKHNLSIRRIPVRLQQRSPSTVKLTIHSLPMLIRILGLRHNWTSGRYDSEVLSGLGSQVYWPRADAPGRTTP
jgi:dolichyl-phosphate beta-glucosyltransferase